MIYGIGTDIVAVARMADYWQRHGERGLEKMLAPAEREACRASPDPGRFLAKRFAAKEALGKAFGTGVRAPVLLPEIAVEHDELGKPSFSYSARPRRPVRRARADRPPFHQRRAGLRRRLRHPGEAMNTLPLGPLMIDVAGLELSAAERERLAIRWSAASSCSPATIATRQQLTALCAEIHALRSPVLPIAIDHEGGRVQRCREGFTHLPPMRRLGDLWDSDPAAAREAAADLGYLLAAELRACGVDYSFTPVLDLDWGPSGVIGDRAFHKNPEAVAELAGALIDGLRAAGMGCCGKHFPGHGWVAADSHLAIPVDERSLAEMEPDLTPYRRLKLDGVMPAHVIYPQVDSRPAGFSPVWLEKLRKEFKFDGVIFSDDLSMEGAAFAGNMVQRAEAAWAAGCDMLLICNSPDAVAEVLGNWTPTPDPCARRASPASPQ
jgi:beta-N-acetylhexosaminidase